MGLVQAPPAPRSDRNQTRGAQMGILRRKKSVSEVERMELYVKTNTISDGKLRKANGVQRVLGASLWHLLWWRV